MSPSWPRHLFDKIYYLLRCRRARKFVRLCGQSGKQGWLAE
jgi:hypothetical protein